MPPSSSLSLRTLSHLITTTPPDILPQTTPYLLSILNNCGTILSATDSHATGKEATDSSILVHKYIVQLSALLQGKSFQARWTAVALIKATIELGGWEILRNSGAWVRGLLGILAKPDPPTTHGIAIVSLTKIYLLMQPYQTLKREIVTPTLPHFISSCLNLVKSRQSSEPREFNIHSPLLPCVLDSFCILLPYHPTLFRPHLSRIGLLINPLLASAPSSVFSDDEQDTEVRVPGAVAPQCSAVAQHLHVLLPYCAPQNTTSEVWLKGFRTTIFEAHQTADQVFRAITEDWEPIAGQLPRRADASAFGNTVGDDGGRTMGLPGWSGIQAGTERLIGLLELLSKYIDIPTAASISLPLGSVMDLLTRIFSLTVPSVREGDNPREDVRLNLQIGRDEREGLWAGLPQVHVAGMKLLVVLIERLGEAFFPMVQLSLDLICWVFKAEESDPDVRTAAYTILSKILGIAGVSMSTPSISSLSRMIKSCCCDLLPPQQQTSVALNTFGQRMQSKKSGNSKGPSANADSFSAPSTLPPSSPQIYGLYPGLRQAAHSLLPQILLNIPSQHLQLSLRSQVDRTAILIQHKEAMIASVLCTPRATGAGKNRSSILPHLVRSFPGDFEVEGLFRPRMPVIPTGRGLLNDVYEEDEEDDMIEDSYPQGESLQRNVANDAASAGASQLGSMPGPPKDQDAQPPQLISSVQQPKDPLLLSSTSKRFYDSTNPEGEESQSNGSPHNPPETHGRHEPPSPKRLRVDSPSNDGGSATQNRESTCPSTAGQNPALAPTFGPAVDSPERATAGARTMHEPTGSAAVAQLGVGIESDDEFEVPELVMDADTDEGEDIDDGVDG